MKLDASQASIAYKYKNVKLKVLKTNENIKFNKKCLEYGVVPNYISIKINSKSAVAKKAKKIAELSWLKCEIKKLYSKKTMLNKLLCQNHIALMNTLHPAQQFNTLFELDSQIGRKIYSKKKTQAKKLNNLVQTQLQSEIIKCNHKFYPRVVNMTNIVFNENELDLLNKGLNFNFPNTGKASLISELIQLLKS